MGNQKVPVLFGEGFGEQIGVKGWSGGEAKDLTISGVNSHDGSSAVLEEVLGIRLQVRIQSELEAIAWLGRFRGADYQGFSPSLHAVVSKPSDEVKVVLSFHSGFPHEVGEVIPCGGESFHVMRIQAPHIPHDRGEVFAERIKAEGLRLHGDSGEQGFSLFNLDRLLEGDATLEDERGVTQVTVFFYYLGQIVLRDAEKTR
jgi:hypothetical protein